MSTCLWFFLLISCHVVVLALASSSSSRLSNRPQGFVATTSLVTNQRRHHKTLALSSSSNDESPPEIDDDDNDNHEDLVPRGGAAGDTLPKQLPTIPTFAQYRKFALPCLGLWVSGPLLSLVDTAFVGLSSGVGGVDQSAKQLAALGPATTFFDGATYLFAFLNVATTNLYSSARAQSGTNNPRTESVVRTAAKVSINCGIGLMFFILTFCRPLLRLYIGDKAASTPGLLDAASDYVSIRALSIPTSLLLGVIQASLLGAKDSVTPLVAILYSTVVNVIGDFVLVNRLKLGLQGAAVATTLAQWAATAALIAPARKKLVKNHSLGIWQKKERVEDGVTGRSFLVFAAPVLTLILGKLAAFGFMTHSAAAVPGQPTPLAAHQIILSLLFACSPFLEVISQTAQTFLPPFLAPVNDHVATMKKKFGKKYDVNQDAQAQEWLAAAKGVATQLLGIGIIAAGVVASTASLVPAYFGNLITSDKVVQNAVKPLAKFLWMGAFFWAPVAVAEGVLLAQRQLGFLAGVYLLSTALLPPALVRVKLSGSGTVQQVWLCFTIFQLVRASFFTGRIWGPGIAKKVLSSVGIGKVKAKPESKAA